MKVVILGYSGLIGKSVIKQLAKNTSYYLICVGRNINNKPYINRRIKYYEWDFASYNDSNLSFLKKANIIINCVGKTDNNYKDLEPINVSFIKKLLNYINLRKLTVRFLHLSSISVYGGGQNYLGQNKIIYENSVFKLNDLYSKSKRKGELLIQNASKKKLNKNFSYTILRISNVFGARKKSNLFKFVMFTLNTRIWINCSNDITFNFVNLKDVTQAIIITISKLKISRNKIYIVSDDCKQFDFYKKYQNLNNKKIFQIPFSISFIKFIIYFIPLPKKLLNFFLIISSKIIYSNEKIKKELNFKPNFSILKKNYK